MNLKTLNILPADVDNKLNVGHKIFSRRKVGDCFNNSVVNVKCILYNILAVACNGRRGNIDFGVDCIDFFKKFLDNLNGISL